MVQKTDKSRQGTYSLKTGPHKNKTMTLINQKVYHEACPAGLVSRAWDP